MTKDKMIEVIIDKKNWARGGLATSPDGLSNYLLNQDGTMCCLGFIAIQACGYPEEDIEEVGSISGITSGPRKNEFIYEKLVSTNANLDSLETMFPIKKLNIDDIQEEHFIHVNDHSTMNDGNRQRAITALGKKIGLDIKFV